MKSLSDTCSDKAPTVSLSPFFYMFINRIHLEMPRDANGPSQPAFC
jgi:hypothetical protein